MRMFSASVGGPGTSSPFRFFNGVFLVQVNRGHATQQQPATPGTIPALTQHRNGLEAKKAYGRSFKMKATRAFTLAVTVFALAVVGCTRPKGSTAEEGHRRIEDSNSNVEDLKAKHGIDLNADPGATKHSLEITDIWAKYSLEDLKTIEAKLNKQIWLTKRIMQIGREKALRLKNGPALVRSADNADLYLKDLKNFKEKNNIR